MNNREQDKGLRTGGPKDVMKNRLPISEMRLPIENFCKEQKEMYIALNNNTDFPELEVAEYRYAEGEHLLILTPASMFLNKLENGSKFTGFIFDKQGRGLKMTKRVYGKFVCEILSVDTTVLKELAQSDDLVKKMLTHGAKFIKLKAESLKVYFSGNEIFDLDENMEPKFAKYAPNGKERFENSRHVLMQYGEKEVIFNTLIENDTYYTLTKTNSNKMKHIKEGKECKFYDGRDNHFTATINILDDSKVEEIFNKLKATNHAYFKTMEGLTALSYIKIK